MQKNSTFFSLLFRQTVTVLKAKLKAIRAKAVTDQVDPYTIMQDCFALENVDRFLAKPTLQNFNLFKADDHREILKLFPVVIGKGDYEREIDFKAFSNAMVAKPMNFVTFFSYAHAYATKKLTMPSYSAPALSRF